MVFNHSRLENVHFLSAKWGISQPISGRHPFDTGHVMGQCLRSVQVTRHGDGGKPGRMVNSLISKPHMEGKKYRIERLELKTIAYPKRMPLEEGK